MSKRTSFHLRKKVVCVKDKTVKKKSTSEVDSQEGQSSSVFKFPSRQTSLPKLVLPSVFQRSAKTPRSPPATPASASPSIVAEDTTQPTTPLERYDLRTPVQPPPLSLGVTPIIEEIRSLPAYPESASSTDSSIAEDQPSVVHQSPELTSQSAEESSRTSTRATMAMVPFAEIYKDIPKCQVITLCLLIVATPGILCHDILLDIIPLTNENTYIKKLGPVCLTDAEWTIAASLEFPNLQTDIQQLGKHAIGVSEMCAAFVWKGLHHRHYHQHYDNCRDIVSRLNYKIKSCQKTLQIINHLLEPKSNYEKQNRQKRGWFDIVGEASKFLFGTATQNDVKDIASKISIIESQSNKLQTLMKYHTSLINSTLSEVESNTHHLAETQKKVNEIISAIDDWESPKDGYTAEMLRRLESIVSSDVVRTQHDLEQLLVVLYSAIGGKCHPLLLHPDDFQSEILNITSKLPEFTALPSLSISELYNIARVFIVGSQKRITAFIKIPLCRKPNYSLFHVFPMPHLKENSTFIVNVQHPYIAVDERFDSYALLDTYQFEKCIKIRNFPICASNIIRSSSVESCEFSILKSAPDACSLIPTNLKINVWLHVDDNTFLFIFPKNNSVEIYCQSGKQTENIKLPPKGIIRINPGCRINDHGIHIFSKTNIESFHETLHRDPLGKVKFIDFQDAKTFKIKPLTIVSNIHDKNVNSLLKETEILSSIQDSKEPRIKELVLKNISGGISILVIVIIITILCIKHRIRSKKGCFRRNTSETNINIGLPAVNRPPISFLVPRPTIQEISEMPELLPALPSSRVDVAVDEDTKDKILRRVIIK